MIPMSRERAAVMKELRKYRGAVRSPRCAIEDAVDVQENGVVVL